MAQLTIWQLVEREMATSIEKFHYELIDVERIEETEYYVCTFRGRMEPPLDYILYTHTIIMRITDEGKCRYASTETVESTEKLYDEDEEWISIADAEKELEQPVTPRQQFRAVAQLREMGIDAKIVGNEKAGAE